MQRIASNRNGFYSRISQGARLTARHAAAGIAKIANFAKILGTEGGVGVLVGISVGTFAGSVCASADPLPALEIPQRLLVVAPHPDDAMLSFGLISRVLEAGGQVQVVDVTSGDHENPVAAKYVQNQGYAKSDQKYLNYGYYRLTEDERALRSLGLKRENSSYLGYPDSGLWSMKSLDEQGSVELYTASSTGANHVPYDNAFRPGAPYQWRSIVQDLATIAKSFGPDAVVLAHPNDANLDHAAVFWLGQQALLRAGLDPTELPIYLPLDTYVMELPTVLTQNQRLAPSIELPSFTHWFELTHTPSEIARKIKFVGHYQSQMASERPFNLPYEETDSYMYGYIGQNELYGIVRPGEVVFDSGFQRSTARRDSVKRAKQVAANVVKGIKLKKQQRH